MILTLYILSVLLSIVVLLWIDTAYEQGKKERKTRYNSNEEDEFMANLTRVIVISLIPFGNLLVCFTLVVKFMLIVRFAKKKSTCDKYQ